MRCAAFGLLVGRSFGTSFGASWPHTTHAAVLPVPRSFRWKRREKYQKQLEHVDCVLILVLVALLMRCNGGGPRLRLNIVKKAAELFFIRHAPPSNPFKVEIQTVFVVLSLLLHGFSFFCVFEISHSSDCATISATRI
uniref:Putative secreted protein n=1 Tax=Anopheles triannulatus TaxID=58253 RepID=A0A2M4B3Q8_9DIPT